MQFQSYNFPKRFIRHRFFQGELSPEGDGPADDFSFTVVERGMGRVALRSVNFPRRWLRHRGFRVLLEEPNRPGDRSFPQDSTFFLDPGLAGDRGVSLRSVNFPDRYIRHRDFHLFLEPRDSPNLAPDATFLEVGSPVLIDGGTVTNPANA